MSVPTDNFAITEHDNHSDSDWLDVASTDRDSDDNDSICSSRETDHEDLSRSRSRRSSLSYGSSRDGDVDAWEGLIEGSTEEGMPNDVPAPNTHVASLSQHTPSTHLHNTLETSPEELRVKEGLDQSMISTLSSSRSSSLHASTVHSSTRDLRLSFPDPITSSCRESLSTSYEEIQPNSDISSSSDSDAPSDPPLIDDEDMPSASQVPSIRPTPSCLPGPELKVFLYGSPSVLKWSIVSRLMQKVTRGAGLAIDSDLEYLQGSVRQLTVSGSFKHDCAFPRIITVCDRTLQPHDSAHDLASTDFSGVRPLVVVFTPCPPLGLPNHVLYLPIVLPSYASELPDLGTVEIGSPQCMWDTLNIPDEQILRITAPEAPPTIDQDSIDKIDSSRAYRAFSRLWAGDNVPKGVMAGTHTLTIIAILSLILGLVVRTALPVSLQQLTAPALVTLNPNYNYSSLWQLLRPAPHRERLSPSTTLDSSVVVIPSSFKDFSLSLSVFSAESTSMTLSRANPTESRLVIPPTLSERPKFSKDLILQPPHSVLPPDNRPKALSVIPETTSPVLSRHPSPDTAGHAVSTLIHTTVPGVVKECASVVSAIMNQDMQDLFDALDALAQAISRQTQMILTQATTFMEMYLEKSVESFETVKETLHAHNERARKQARDIKEWGVRWLYDASEVVATSARFSRGMALELAEGLAHRAERARGKAQEMAVDIQDFLNEYDGLEALTVDAWDSQARQWDEWVKTMRTQGKWSCRQVGSSIFC